MNVNNKEYCYKNICSTLNVEFSEPLSTNQKPNKPEKKSSVKPKSDDSKSRKKTQNASTSFKKSSKQVSLESIAGEGTCKCGVFPCDELVLVLEEKDARRTDSPVVSKELLTTVKSTSFLDEGFALRNVESIDKAAKKTAQYAKDGEITDDSILKTGFGLRSVKSLQNALVTEKKRHTESDLCTGFGLKKLDSLQRLIKKEERKQKELLHGLKDEEINPYQDMPLKSLLKTGFGLRDTDSLAHAILEEEFLKQIAKEEAEEEYQEQSFQAIREQTSTIASWSQTSDLSTKPKPQIRDYIKQISYEDEMDEGKDKGISMLGRRMIPLTAAMKKAQNYLRQHRIFEFFHFLIAHLISKRPENPISFLIDLLNKCLLYRSGLLPPPLLYQREHLAIMFDMMDPMHTGLIDVEQYITAMKTLGICSFKKNPKMTSQKKIEKETFVNEAHTSLVELLCDLIRRRWSVSSRASFPITIPNPPPTLMSMDFPFQVQLQPEN